MGNLGILFKRELASYFATPLAYIFIVIFLITNGLFTFELGGFFLRGQADLLPFFSFHPWLYLFMVPAIAMTLWADERKTGTIELLLTLPVRLVDAVLGKFLAAWALTGIALALTFPIWITVNYLGEPDNGVIFAAYLGSWFMAGGFLAIGCDEEFGDRVYSYGQPMFCLRHHGLAHIARRLSCVGAASCCRCLRSHGFPHALRFHL